MANNNFEQTEHLGLYIAPSTEDQIRFLDWRNHMGGTVSAQGGSNMHLIDKAFGDMEKEKADKSITVIHMISADSWVTENGVTHCYFTHESITPTCPVELIPGEAITKEQYDSIKDADIIGGTQTAGSIELIAMGETPEIDIPVRFIVRGDI